MIRLLNLIFVHVTGGWI